MRQPIKNIILFFLCASPILSQGQNMDIDISRLFANLSCKSNVFVCSKIVCWDNDDFKLIRSFPNEVKNTCSDSTEQEYEALERNIKNVVQTNLQKEAVPGERLCWHKSLFPRNFKILDSANYYTQAKKETMVRQIHLQGYCAISMPLFSPDKKFAIVKVDYNGLKINSNICLVQYYFCRKKSNHWCIQHVRGVNCMIE